MPAPSEAGRKSVDHFFVATQRWLERNEISTIAMLCHCGHDAPLGTKRRPAVETPGCLRDLPLHRWLDLYLAGVRDVAVVFDACCTDKECAETVAGWQQNLGDLLQFTVTAAVAARNWAWSVSPSRIPVDRRGLLGLSRQSSSWPTHESGTDDHARLLTSMRAAGIESLQEPPAGLALLASGCTACGVCIKVCPNEALTLVVEDLATSLHHSAAVCHGEQDCIALCPEDALSFTGPLPWSDVLDGTPRVLATMEMAVCERCRTRFPAAAGQRWCETCRIRRSDPFGSHLPAAALDLLRARGHDHSV